MPSTWSTSPPKGPAPVRHRAFRSPEDFPAFGRPVLAPADGVVVRVHGRERDHRSRSSRPSLLYLFAEGSLRELTGPGRVLGNHVVLDLGDGVYAVLAHLRRGSLRVTKGQRVAAGEQVAECGNSGNSTEPHLHFQLQDHPSVLFAAGLPFRLARFEVDGTLQAGSRPTASRSRPPRRAASWRTAASGREPPHPRWCMHSRQRVRGGPTTGRTGTRRAGTRGRCACL